ncbi:hypothetical protein BKA62DRAFT_463125 [Auriculariales sp. MPI-PUGE-AT-0066]|nr:hypothetical protein BKA62DRAFT_463125 [Auriculariales sp. MPI-PUGE-AT-0066]
MQMIAGSVTIHRTTRHEEVPLSSPLFFYPSHTHNPTLDANTTYACAAAMGECDHSCQLPSFTSTALPPILAGSRDSFEDLFYTELFSGSKPAEKEHRRSLTIDSLDKLKAAVRPSENGPTTHISAHQASSSMDGISCRSPAKSVLRPIRHSRSSSMQHISVAQEVGRGSFDSLRHTRFQRRSPMQLDILLTKSLLAQSSSTSQSTFSTIRAATQEQASSRPSTPSRHMHPGKIVISPATPSPTSSPSKGRNVLGLRIPYTRSQSMQTVPTVPHPLPHRPGSFHGADLFEEDDDPFANYSAGASDDNETLFAQFPVGASEFGEISSSSINSTTMRAPLPYPLCYYSQPSSPISSSEAIEPPRRRSTMSSDESESSSGPPASACTVSSSKSQTFSQKAGKAVKSLPRVLSRKFARKQSCADLTTYTASASNQSFVSGGKDDYILRQNAPLTEVKDSTSFKRLFKTPASAPPVPPLKSRRYVCDGSVQPSMSIMSAPSSPSRASMRLLRNHSKALPLLPPQLEDPLKSRWSGHTDDSRSDTGHSEEDQSLFHPFDSPDLHSPEFSTCTTVDGSSPEAGCQPQMPDSAATVTNVQELFQQCRGMSIVRSRIVIEPTADDQLSRSSSLALGLGWPASTIGGDHVRDEAVRSRPAMFVAPALADGSRGSSRCSSLGLTGMMWPVPPTRKVIVDAELRQARQEITPNTEFISSSSPPTFSSRGGAELCINALVSALQSSPHISTDSPSTSIDTTGKHARGTLSEDVDKKVVLHLVNSLLDSARSTLTQHDTSPPTTPILTVSMPYERPAHLLPSQPSPGLLSPPPPFSKPRASTNSPVYEAPHSMTFRTDEPGAMLPAKIFIGREESVAIEAPTWSELQAFCRANEDTIIREEARRPDAGHDAVGGTMPLLQVCVWELGEYHVTNGQADINRPFRKPRVQMSLMLQPRAAPPLYSSGRNRSAPVLTPASASSCYSTYSQYSPISPQPRDVSTGSSTDSPHTQRSSTFTPALTIDTSTTGSSSGSSGLPSAMTDSAFSAGPFEHGALTGIVLPSALAMDFSAPLRTPNGTIMGLASLDVNCIVKTQPQQPESQLRSPLSAVTRGRPRGRKPLHVVIPDAHTGPRTLILRELMVTLKVPMPTLIGQIGALAAQRSVGDGVSAGHL